MGRFSSEVDRFEMMTTLTEIMQNGHWWELRAGKRMLGRSTSKVIVEGWQSELRNNGFIDAESNV